ncbi:MAG TPA: SCO family protein [Opitutaceae bacterium]|nr:SCO family protein [Opitutaceae bacterium]
MRPCAQLAAATRTRLPARVSAWAAQFVVLLFLVSGPVARANAPYSSLHYDQNIGRALPLNLVFTDESGQPFDLHEAFGQGPVVLVFGYWHCPQLCSVVSNAAIQALRQLRPEAGNRFSYVYVSIDKSDTPRDAAVAKAHDLKLFAHAGAEPRWHYLVGSEANVRALADAAGFNYKFDQPTKEYAHPSGFVIVTPSGVISRYFLGIDFKSEEIAKSLRDAAKGGTGNPVFDLVLLCFRGEGITGPYGKIIWHVLQVAVTSTVLALVLGIARMLRDERRGVTKGVS